MPNAFNLEETPQFEFLSFALNTMDGIGSWARFQEVE